jgi:hypothetical protein
MFPLNNKEDFIVYLQQLIIRVDIRLQRYKRYLDEISKDMLKYELLKKENVLIPAKLYEEYTDLFGNTQKHLVNLIADNTKSAMSYLKFRKIAEKQEFGLVKIDNFTTELINDINVLRNWSLHAPESMLVAEREVLGNISFKMPYSLIEIPIFEKYEGIWLVSLYLEADGLYRRIRHIFQQMKKDYSFLINKSMEICHRDLNVRPFDKMSIDVPAISMQIQKGKYKVDNASEEV